MCKGKEEGGRRCPMPSIRRKEQRLSSYAEKRSEANSQLQSLETDRDEIDQLIISASPAAAVQLRDKRREIAREIKALYRTLNGIESQVKKIHEDLAVYRKERMEETETFLKNSFDRYQALKENGITGTRLERARAAVQEDNDKWGEAQADYDSTDEGFKELEQLKNSKTLTEQEKQWVENRYAVARTMRSLARIQLRTQPESGVPQIQF